MTTRVFASKRSERSNPSSTCHSALDAESPAYTRGIATSADGLLAMTTRMKIACVILLIISFSPSLWALMPPMEVKELEQASTALVEGEITRVDCNGKKTDTDCAVNQGYRATLKVTKVIKQFASGTASIDWTKPIPLDFTHTVFKRGCVGSPDVVHVVGEQARYYLSCSEQACWLTHWNGITYLKDGATSLPQCP